MIQDGRQRFGEYKACNQRTNPQPANPRPKYADFCGGSFIKALDLSPKRGIPSLRRQSPKLEGVRRLQSVIRLASRVVVAGNLKSW